MIDRFFGLWIPKGEDIETIIKSGVWKNKLSNKQRIPKQLQNIKVGDKVFLFSYVEDIPLKDSPYKEYINPDDYNVEKIVKVKSYAIGEVERVDLENSSLYIKWDKDYKPIEWYNYYRADGIWYFDLKNSSKQKKEKYEEFYKMVFEGKQQDYKWWLDKGVLNRYRKKDIKIKEIKKNSINIKNIILYGAPGVGKTHNINKLITLIDNGTSWQDIFEAIKTNEKSKSIDIKDIKNRVKFVTFHQSFGYEDFIEGFRPNEDGNIELVDGVFKSICKEAHTNKNQFSLYSGKLVSADRAEYTIETILKDLIILKSNNNRKIPIPIELINELIENIKSNNISLEDIKNKNLENVELSYDKYMYGYKSVLYALCKSIIEESYFNKLKNKNYYIVIDEINRANISKVFGELITLIEEDKRDKLEVILPYSKEPFSVPSNLYIIGTMNSTDKSIALLDVALRRRFTFIKVKPNENLVIEEFREKFIKLNEFIANTLGEDYQIGHSYFMNISKDDLDFVIEYKIKPLLEEYFYGDNEKLQEAISLLEI